MLTKFHPLFEYVPIESVVRARQKKYYRALEAADAGLNSTPFVEFMLEAIFDGTQEFLRTLRTDRVTADHRLESAHGQFGRRWFSRKDYIVFFVKLSTATASRDLKGGTAKKLLERKGTKSLACYRFAHTKKD